jgi:uncharacterized membrane protein
MKIERRIVAYVLYIVLGAVLVGLGILEILDSFWSGMGGAWIAVGAIRIVQMVRYSKDKGYQEKMDTALKDERNQFIRNKAWAWSGYMFVIIAAVATIVFRLMGQELLSMAASFAICILLVLYWVSYVVLNRKY